MPAPPSVDNFTKFQGHGVSIPTAWYSDRYYADGNNPPQDTTKNAELAAWMCNQVDNCQGFMRRRGNNELWFYDRSQPMTHANVSGDTLDTYIKNGNNVRKVNQPDTSDPSILSNPTTRVIFNNASDGFNATYGSHSYVGNNGGLFSAIPDRADFNGYNNIGAVTVPLGWRFLDGDNGWASGQGGCCHNSVLSGDGTKKSNWGNYNDGILVENRGFDVPSNWDTMVSKGVDPDDAFLIKRKYCNTLDALTLTSETGTGPAGQFNGHGWKNACTQDIPGQGRVLNNTPCGTSCTDADFDGVFMAKIQKDEAFAWAVSGSSALKHLKDLVLQVGVTNTDALTMFQKYCRGSNGTDPHGQGKGRKATVMGTPNAGICACMNVNDFGIQGPNSCLSSSTLPDGTLIKNLPGCTGYTVGSTPVRGMDDLFSQVPATVLTQMSQTTASMTNAGCLSQACGSNMGFSTTETLTLPFTNQNCAGATINLAVCTNNVNIGAAIDSSIQIHCNNTINNNSGSPASTTSSKGSPGASPGASPGPAPSPPPSLPVPALKSILNTPSKQYGGIGGCVCIILMCCLIIIVMAMSGDNENSGGGIAALLAAQGAGSSATAGS